MGARVTLLVGSGEPFGECPTCAQVVRFGSLGELEQGSRIGDAPLGNPAADGGGVRIHDGAGLGAPTHPSNHLRHRIGDASLSSLCHGAPLPEAPPEGKPDTKKGLALIAALMYALRMSKHTNAAQIGTAVPVPEPQHMPCLANVSPRCPTPRDASGYCPAHQPAPAPRPSGIVTESAIDRGMRAEQAYQRRRYVGDDVLCPTCARNSCEVYPRTHVCDHLPGREIDYIGGKPWRVRWVRGGAR